MSHIAQQPDWLANAMARVSVHLVAGVAWIVSHFRIQNEMSHKPCYLGSWRQPAAFTWPCCRRSARHLIWTFHSEGNVLSFAQDIVQTLIVKFHQLIYTIHIISDVSTFRVSENVFLCWQIYWLYKRKSANVCFRVKNLV